MNDIFRVGQVSTAHGIKGALKVMPTTDNAERFKSLKKVGYSKGDEPEIIRELTVTGVAFSGGQVLLSTKEITDRNEAELLRGGSLWIPREEAVALRENEFFIADYIGGTAMSDEGELLGTIVDIMQLKSNEVVVIQKDDKELLVPVIKDCIVGLNPEESRMVIHLLPGLR